MKSKQGSCHKWGMGMGYVYPQPVIHCLLQYVAGRSHREIGFLACVEKSTFSHVSIGV